MQSLTSEIQEYNQTLDSVDKAIADKLANLLNAGLPKAKAKVWHRHPVWFSDGNPLVGYNRIKAGMRLMFWSGQSFEEKDLNATGSFKAAEITYTSLNQIDDYEIRRWLDKAEKIQWDYKNIVKRKGKLQLLI